MNKIKVSVIIPVYNAEKFIERCLESVIHQSLSDIELIIVNDGSKDGSLDILRKYKNQYSNVVLIEQENTGQGVARNRAIEVAQGDFLSFVDSDDYIEKDMLKILYQNAIENDADIVVCNWDEIDENDQVLNYIDHEYYHNKIFDSKEIIKEFLNGEDQLIEGFSWNKLIKRSLFTTYGIEYPNMIFEDIPTIFKLLIKANRCVYLNNRLYHYVQHNNSTVHSRNVQGVKDYVMALQMIKDILMEGGLIKEFESDYLIYSSHRLLREYGFSYEKIQSSKVLNADFKNILKGFTIKWFFGEKAAKDFKLLIKILLYKVGLLPYVFKMKDSKLIAKRD